MKLLAIAVVFIIGLIFCCTYTHSDIVEGFYASGECPNLLVQKGKELHLIYSNKAKIPGVNPVKFNNLEDYVEFLDWQRAKGIRCPVLYFQQTYDAQNKLGYRMLPDPVEKQAGLPSVAPQRAKEQPLYDSSHDDMPYNKNSYPGYDAIDQYVGAYTPLDKNFRSSEKTSANAMDPQWGGALYSQEQVEGGVYEQDARVGYDNPYISKQKESAFKAKMPRSPTMRPRGKGRVVSPEEAKEIASRYGGSTVNAPASRALAGVPHTNR